MEKKKQATKSREIPETKSPGKDKKEEGALRSFTRYSGIGFQMVIVILLFYWAGSRLDIRAGTDKPVYTAIFTILGVFAGMYLALKDFIGKRDD